VVLRKWQDAKNVFPSAPVALYGCQTWSLTLREELKLQVFQMELQRIIFGSKMEYRSEYDCIMMMIIIILLLGRSNQEERHGRGM
jgi:hypothetical protein